MLARAISYVGVLISYLGFELSLKVRRVEKSRQYTEVLNLSFLVTMVAVVSPSSRSKCRGVFQIISVVADNVRCPYS